MAPNPTPRMERCQQTVACDIARSPIESHVRRDSSLRKAYVFNNKFTFKPALYFSTLDNITF